MYVDFVADIYEYNTLQYSYTFPMILELNWKLYEYINQLSYISKTKVGSVQKCLIRTAHLIEKYSERKLRV